MPARDRYPGPMRVTGPARALLGLCLCSPTLAGGVHEQEAAAPCSAHAAQAEELGVALSETTDDGRRAEELEAAGLLFPPRAAGTPGPSALATNPASPGSPGGQYGPGGPGGPGAPGGPGSGSRGPLAPGQPSAQSDFIVFGYLQSESMVYHLRWQALTHIGTRFVGFDASGSLTGTSAFTARSSYLKEGGAADDAGVKVILVVNQFDDDPGGVIETVMTSATRRTRLVDEIGSLISSDSYVHGVSMDLEFGWGSAVRDGLTAFMVELRAELDRLDPALETSVYTNAIYLENQWDFHPETGLTPQIDYMLYSMYDWATGSTARAISDFDNCIGSTRMRAYLDAGLPPEKLVPTISSYSRSWNGVSTYGASGYGSSSAGYTDALFDLTLRPFTAGTGNYVTGDEAGWYTWNDGVSHVRTWEGRAGMEWKIRQALSFHDPSGNWNGRRLGGVGFWSLYWLAETSSIDPRTGASVSRTRTYPEVYQMCQELLASPGQERFTLETFAGYDFRWRAPHKSPDTLGDTDNNSTWRIVNTPPGFPGFADSDHAAEVTLDVEGSGVNQVVFAHEVLASPLAPTIPDTHATLGQIKPNSLISARLYTPERLSGWSVSLLLIDGDGELEKSPPTSLDRSGWTPLTWDISAPGGVLPHATLEPAFLSGDGHLDSNMTSPEAARDISLYGFVFSGRGPLSASVVLDELAHQSTLQGAAHYTINELRYAGVDREFLEIWGPAGPLPADFELRFYDSSDGTVLRSFPLSGTIRAVSQGRGPFVLGDPGTDGVDSNGNMSEDGDDFPDVDPSACQLVVAGRAHDSLVYEAFGGLDELIRRECAGVTDEGYPWVGGVASGQDSAGQPYSLGRYPDGRDSNVNGADFSFQIASPGARNGAALTLPAEIDFETPPPGLFQTYDSPRFTNPTSAGLPPAPSGGLAWRCVDSVGGGVLGLVGDAALGFGAGYVATGEIYIPAQSAAPCAIGVGIGGRQGSSFFTTWGTDAMAYESGLWLIFENAAGVGLADGRPDHPGTWELVLASHDNLDGEPVQLLDSFTNSELNLTPGTWTSFEFQLDPLGPNGGHLAIELAGTTLYSGPIPADLDCAGALQVGFRENHPGPPSAAEGVWLDGLHIR